MYRRTQMDAILDRLDWQPAEAGHPTDGDVPYVTHQGILEIAGYRLRVYQLSDGQRIIDGEDFEAVFGNVSDIVGKAQGGK